VDLLVLWDTTNKLANMLQKVVVVANIEQWAYEIYWSFLTNYS